MGRGGLVSYDAASWLGMRLLFQSEGSVYKSAIWPACLAALLFTILRLPMVDYAHHAYPSTSKSPAGKDGKEMLFAYGVVSFALAFSLVSRAGMCYNRFWEGRFHLAFFDSRLMDLTIYCKAFPKKTGNIKVHGVEHACDQAFQEEMSRLLRLFTKIALGALQDDPWEPADWDPRTYGAETLMTNAEMQLLAANQNRPLMVMCWMMDAVAGYPHWNVPPPVKTRFFQMASEVMLAFNQSSKIVDSTFPFPMLQISMATLHVYAISWPFVIAMMAKHFAWGLMTSFVPVFAFFAVNTIALELQDPFGDDANDLPLPEIHDSMCRNIRVVLDPWNFDFVGQEEGPGVDGPTATMGEKPS